VKSGALAAGTSVGVLDPSHVSLEIATTAARQHGHVSRGQLRELGMNDMLTSRWCAAGRLVRVHLGVYAVGHRRVEPVAIAMAAVLACGDRALLSHDSAAAPWGWRRRPWIPEVTAPWARRRAGIRSHRSRSLSDADRTRELGVPVTTPARTIADLKPRLTQRQFTRMVNQARREHRLTDAAVARLLGYASGPIRSEFEAAFIRFCRRHGLPAPQPLATIAGYEVDVLFRQKLVELDGWEFHDDRAAFGTDRERDAALLQQGYATVRITWDRLHDQPVREAARRRAILAAREVRQLSSPRAIARHASQRGHGGFHG
jgi:hypothetical protein